MGMKKFVLVLIGQIGAGKTEVGRRVADITGAHFVSVDELRARQSDTKIPNLVQTLAAEVTDRPLIFECTGAAPDFEDLLASLEDKGWQTFVVLLDCSIETAMRRIRGRRDWASPTVGGSWLPHLRWTQTQLRMVPADVYLATDTLLPDEVAATVAEVWESATTARRVIRAGTQPTGTFSFSQLASFDICPLEYRYKFVDRQREFIETEQMFLGERLHEALHYLYGLMATPVTEKELLAYFATRVREAAPAATTQAQMTDLIERGSKVLKFYFTNEYRPEAEKTIAVEKSFAIELASGLLFVGRIDRIALAPSGTYEVIDYKTSMRISTSRPRIPDLLQLTAYGAAALLEYRAPAVLVRRHQLGTGNNDEVVLREADVGRIHRALRRWINRVWLTTAFTARPGLHCRSCQFNPICPRAALPPAPTALKLTTFAPYSDQE